MVESFGALVVVILVHAAARSLFVWLRSRGKRGE